MRIGEYPPQRAEVHGHVYSAATVEPDADARDVEASITPELAALTALGFSKPFLASMRGFAQQNGTSIEAELLRSGKVSEEAYYGAMARLLRLPFVADIDPPLIQDGPLLDTQLTRPTMLRLAHRNRQPQTVIVPEAFRLADLAAAIATMPQLARDLAITTPGAIRSAVWQAGAKRRARDTSNGLFEGSPSFSARVVLSGAQGFTAGALIAALIAAILIAPAPTLLLLHVTLSLIYLASLVIRLTALAFRMRRQAGAEPSNMPTGGLPPYTVMVALYREADVVQQLAASLRRLDWPPSLLDIKLVCEDDDEETLAALWALRLPPQFEIIRVPPLGPRTKPKALTYALASVRGEFVAIFDAEDRPHPAQLKEAYMRFRSGPIELACLQAPLIIANADESWISALFSLEYSALFRGVLPMLGAGRLPLPLGGTSNHFKTEVLRQAGGWDPFNVTEDADMGLRLYRLGYRADVLSRQTLEDAPVELGVWMAQRSRWFKGWLQTWLVLMRNPLRLVGELGFKPCLIFQLMIGGMLISALLHPLIFVFLWLGASAMLAPPNDHLPAGVLSLFVVDFINIVGSYLIFVGLGIGSMIDHEKRLLGWRWVFVPAYWLMISIASWRAVIELNTKPFHWNKTPHKPSPVSAPTGDLFATKI